MADNVPITAGVGTNVATDDIGGVHYQRVKVALGPNGTYTADADGTAERGQYVDPRVLTATVKVVPTVSTTPAYSAKDAVGSNMTFAGVARANNGSGRIVKVVITDKGQQFAALDLVIFNTAPAAATDNAAFDPTDAELASDLCEGVIPISAGAWSDFFDNAIATVPCNLPFRCAAASTSLFGVLVARGTPTYTSTSDLAVTIFVELD